MSRDEARSKADIDFAVGIGIEDPPVARLLLGAGAIIAPADIPSGDAAVDAILREHGLL